MFKKLIQIISLFALTSSIFVSVAQAQFATVGGGLLISERPLQPVAEFNAQTPSLFNSRAYITLSWTDESVKPTIITAVERSVFRIDDAFSTSVGTGLLWLEPNKYKPDLMLVSSTVIPLTIQNTSFVIIGSAFSNQILMHLVVKLLKSLQLVLLLILIRFTTLAKTKM